MGEAIVDNIAVGNAPPTQSTKTEAFHDLTELKKAKFQLLYDKRKH